MNICFRVDSSTVIGTGHIVRCLTLAKEFYAGGNDVTFICRELPGNIINQIKNAGFKVYKLPKANYEDFDQESKGDHRSWLAIDWLTDARQTRDILKSFDQPVDLLIVDHYALEEKWEMEIKENYQYLMVIDDLADREHICDFLLDQNLYRNLEIRYDQLIPNSAFKMLGPTYALLRPEFARARKNLNAHNGEVRNILIFFGGSDASNQTQKVLETIIPMKLNNIHFDIVIGNSNLYKNDIENLCVNLKYIKLHCQIDYMAELMANSDLAIGGGGTTTWERCCLGLPSLTIAVAENQVMVAKLSEEMGFARYLGYHTDIDKATIQSQLEYLLESPDELIKMSKNGLRFVDGLGTSRVIGNILKFQDDKLNVKP